MKYVFRVISALCVLLFTLLFYPSPSLAEETGFLFPTTCVTDGTNCQNMQLQDTFYNSWTNTNSESIDLTFSDINIPADAVIDDIQVKLRVRTFPNGGWTWFVQASTDEGNTYFPPLNCTLFGEACRYNTQAKVFNDIENTTLTWINNNPSQVITGQLLTSQQFRLKLFQSGGTKSTDIDTISVNIRYNTATTSAKTPVIFIPGIGGSELKVVNETNWAEPDGHGGTFFHNYAANEKIWVNTDEAAKPGNDDYFDILRMEPDGKLSAAPIATTDLFPGAYQQTIDLLIDQGYKLNETLFVFPYDWRKDNAIHVPLLEQKIAEIKEQTGFEKVDLVAHSMGGLIARKYIADTEAAQNVRKLVTLGTPHLGSVKSIKTLMYGDCLTDVKIERLNLPFCLGITPDAIKDVYTSLISGFQISPTKLYFDFYTDTDSSHPYPFVDLRDIDNNGKTGILNYDEIKTLLTNLGYNTNLFTASEAFHSLDEALDSTNGVDVRLIAGSGIATLGQIIETYKVNFYGMKSPRRELMMINGDQTVPLLSASLHDPAHNKSLLGDAKVYYTKQNHGDIVLPGPAMTLLRNILAENTQLPTGVSTTPFYFKGKAISSHSPVALHVYDGQGNHTGPTSDGFEQKIPGSQYDMLDDETFIFLPEDGVYTIKLYATGEGSFDLVIKDYENDVNTYTTLYKNIPLTTVTTAEAVLDTSITAPPVLAVDENGDTIADKEVSATSQTTGEENSDLTSPVTHISLEGTTGTNGWFTSNVQVNLAASDENSGVAKTEYTLDNGNYVQTYTEPFTLTGDGTYTLKVKSIDAAGNEEIPHEQIIKIDTTPPEAKISIDHEQQDLVVTGIDQNPTTISKQTKPRTQAIYKVTDEAGNTLQLDVRDIDFGRVDVFRVFSLKYNPSSPLVIDSNHYVVLYQGLRHILNILEQYFESKGDIKIRIAYDKKKDKSTIYTKLGKRLQIKEVQNGVTILQLKTSAGVLEYSY